MKIKLTHQDDRLVAASRLCSLISSEGYKAFIVGGFVRDLIIYETADYEDIDIATNMPIDMLKNKFKTQSNNGEKHGTILVKSMDFYFEVTQFRSESTYSNGRSPDEVQFVFSFREDTERRDFTINAFGLESDFHVIDYHKGLSDIRAKLIRCVGNPDERFLEDYLRMLRAVRFAAKLNFAIEEKTLASICNHSHNIKKISRERIHAECTKACKFEPNQVKYFFKLLVYTKLFNHIFQLPENYDFSFLSSFNTCSLPFVMFGIYKKLGKKIDYKDCFKAPVEEIEIYNTLVSLYDSKNLKVNFKILNKYAKSKAFAEICKNYIAEDDFKKFLDSINQALEDLYIETESKTYKDSISYINVLAINEDLSGKDIGEFVEKYVDTTIQKYSSVEVFK